jgi:methylated-DNA-[protein]-cysteine S-methyltransferase
MNSTVFESPLGRLTLVGDDAGLRHVYFPDRAPAPLRHEPARGPVQRAVDQLKAYFAGERDDFDLPLALAGTAFQRQVWARLQQIPYGATTSYGEVASALGVGRERGAPEPRAVAAAIARTPVPIVIPCHRVIGADGSLTGYGGGLRRKRALLEFEAAGGRPQALSAALVPRQLALL